MWVERAARGYQSHGNLNEMRCDQQFVVAALLVLPLGSFGLLGCRDDALLGRNLGSGGAPVAVSDGAAGRDAALTDGAAALADGAALQPGCQVTACDSRIYACGDCLDNDADGQTDDADPECLGVCDDEEERLATGIPGQNQAQCRMDCYFDSDSGSGNDQCEWDHRCDPLSVAPDFPPSGEAACEYDPAFTIGTATCSEAQTTASDTCLQACLPLTPNGCDCFGCCEISRASGQFVWIGNEQNGLGTCELGLISDPMACPPCTPVMGCHNPCDDCERCIGETAIPAGCAVSNDGGP